MTVQDLIDKLEAVKDKSVPVVLTEWAIQNPLHTKWEVTKDRVVVQPHRVAIITD